MRIIGIASVLVLATLSLTGCRSNDQIEQQRLQICVQHGGSYWADEDNNDYSCTLPGVPNPHR